MRIAVFLLLVAAPLLSAARAEAQNCAPTGIAASLFTIDVPDEDMRRSPTWLPDDGEPPLVPWRAARIVQDWAEHEYAETDGVRITVVELRREFCQVDTDRWFYLVQFTIGRDNSRHGSRGLFAIVLLNGRLFPPQLRHPSDLDDL